MSTFCPRKSKNSNSNIFLFAAAGGDFSSLFFGQRKMTFPCYAKSRLYRLQLVVASQKKEYLSARKVYRVEVVFLHFSIKLTLKH